MSDDIDIEEHDIMDKVKEIYLDPNIIVKKELFMDYEDEETDFHHTLPQYPLHTVEGIHKGLVEINNADSTTDMLTDVPSADHPAPSPQTVTSTNEQAVAPYERNKIILGFKKTKAHKDNTCPNATGKFEARCFDAQLLLEDCGEYLTGCNRFCEDCCTLFSNENLYESHRMAHHSHLVALPTPQIVRTETLIGPRRFPVAEPGRFPINEPRRFPAAEPGRFPCKLCNVVLLRRKYLLRHYRSIHNKSYLEVENQIKHMEVCFVCKKALPTKDDLINHLYAHHHSAKAYNCSICSKQFKDKKTLEEHLFQHAKDKVKQQSLGRPDGQNPTSVKHPSAKKSTSTTIKQTATNPESIFPCEFCDRIFYGKFSLRSHKSFAHKKSSRSFAEPIVPSETVHPSKAPSNTMARKVSTKRKVNTALRTYKCKICSASYIQSKSCRSHVLRKHDCAQPDNFIETVIQPFTKGHQPQYLGNKYVYECRKCSLRLHTYKSCYRHYRAVHKKRSGTNMIKRIVINAATKKPTPVANVARPTNKINVAPRGVIFKCRVCSVCFLSYHIAINHLSHANVVSAKCAVCELDFSKDDIAPHYKQHSYESSFKVILTEQKLMQRLLSSCPLCNVHYPESKLQLHLNQCRGLMLGSFVCHICHFPIDSKFQASHKESHKEFKRASDFIVIKYDIITEKSTSDQASTSIVPVTHQNGDSFDVDDEESNQSVLLERYNSITAIWNFLYLCNTCDIAIDNYTQLVGHCHDHYCAKKGILKVVSTKCNICSLSFDEKCYDRHYQLHIDNNRITRKSFNILQFHYTKLLKPTWMEEVFSSCSAENIDQLTGNSVYKNIRNIKLEIVRKGQTEFTVYMCFRCKTIVQEDYVSVHLARYRDGKCIKNARVRSKKCIACNLSFVGNRSWRRHEDLHKTSKISADTFRVIAFNKAQDVKINNILHNAAKFSWGKFEKYNLYKCRKCEVAMYAQGAKTHMSLTYDCASLKNEYINCTHCGFLFQRNGFYKHLARHKDVSYNKDNINVILFGNTDDIAPAENSETKYRIYRCKKCKLCLHNKPNVNKHFCNSVKHSKTCTNCSLTFSPQIYSDHMKKHSALKSFNLENMYVIDFDPIASEDKREGTKKITPNYVLYQCEHCHRNVLKASSAIRHQKLSGMCKASSNVMCNLCGLMFWNAKTYLHREMHKQRPGFQRKNFKIVMFDSNTVLRNLLPHDKDRFDPSVDFLHYECQKCMTLLSSKYAAKAHISSCKINAVTIKCTKCQYYISHDTLSKHMKKHKIHPLMTRNNMRVVKFSSHVPDYDMMDDDDQCHVQIDESAMKKIWNKNSGEKVRGGKRYKLYQCPKCKECFHRLLIIGKHMTQDCKIYNDRARTKCRICGFVFKKKNLAKDRRHMVNHTRPDFTKDNVEIIIYNASDVNQSKEKHNYCELDDTPNTASHSESDVSQLDDDADTDINNTGTAPHSESTGNRLKRKHNYCELDDSDTQSTGDKRSKHDAKNVQLYKCEFCAVHITVNSLKAHSNAHTWDKTPGIECHICGLNILRRSLKNHIDVHHTKLNLKLNDFKITTFKPHMIGSSATPTASQTQTSGPDRWKDNKQDDTLTAHVFDTGSYSKKLYKCNVCQLHFITKCSFTAHHKTPHTENIVRDKVRCRKCKLSFTPLSCKRHVYIHHNNYNLKLKDFEIVSDVNDIANVGTEGESGLNSAMYSNKVYKCEICDIYFVTMTSLKKHSDRPHTQCTMVMLTHCQICNFRMSKTSYKRHMELHHNELNLKLKDIDIVTYDSRTRKVKLNGVVCKYTDGNGFEESFTPIVDDNNDAVTNKSSNNLDTEDSTDSNVTNDNTFDVNLEQNNTDNDVDEDVVDKTETDNNVDGPDIDIEPKQASEEHGKDEVENVDLTTGFNCKICNEEFTMTKALEIHMKLDHLDKEVECPMCKATFNMSILNKIHLRESHNVLKCCICKERISKEQLQSHAANHR